MKKFTLKPALLKYGLLVIILLAPAIVAGKSSMVGKVGPDFAGLSFDGYSHRLDEFKGKVIMINFWASWCGPCRQEMPPLEQLYQQYRSLGFVIVGVNVDEKLEPAKKMLDKLGITYPNVFDSDNNISKGYNVSAMPMTVIMDTTGTIRYVHYGFKSGYMDKYSREVRQLLTEAQQ